MNEELCGCCSGLEAQTPETIANRPGLDALAYRVGTHSAFLETMKARLTGLYLEWASPEGGDPKRTYPLHALTTRETSDPAIALLDAWATVADVLTFYQERIANEGYLRTATERFSIQELARLVGYTLRPGVSASVYLAFTMEDGYAGEVPEGTRAQSLPAPGELPQPFETSEPLEARAAWNAIRPRQTQPQRIDDQTDELYFEGTATNLSPNALLLVGDDTRPYYWSRVEAVERQTDANRTRVTLQDPLGRARGHATLDRFDDAAAPLQQVLALVLPGVDNGP